MNPLFRIQSFIIIKELREKSQNILNPLKIRQIYQAYEKYD